MAIARHGRGPTAVARAYVSQVHPVFMLPPIATALFGAALAADGRAVAALTGDGGLNMVLGELETARRMGLAFALIVVNNAASGYVKALQHLMYGADAYQSSDLTEVDYATVARAMGCHGIRVDDPDRIADALAEALATPGRPTVVDVVGTRDPSQMLPGVDARVAQARKGDRVA